MARPRRAPRAQSSETAPGTTIRSAATRCKRIWQRWTFVYTGVIEDIRKAVDETEELDKVTQDILIDQAAELEKFQWFVRAHLESAGGKLAHEGSATEQHAASTARRKT